MRNVRLLGDMPSTSVRRIVQHAGAVLNLGEEEFGIAVHEALLAQTPVIVAADSEAAGFVRKMQCGYVVDHASPSEVKEAIAALAVLRVDWAAVIDYLSTYNMARFRKQILSAIYSDGIG